jgi:hypothetical protein
VLFGAILSLAEMRLEVKFVLKGLALLTAMKLQSKQHSLNTGCLR